MPAKIYERVPSPYETQESLKAMRIGRATAMNMAGASVEAFARVFASTESCKKYTEDKIQSLLRSIKQSEYQDNLNLLQVAGDDEIPF